MKAIRLTKKKLWKGMGGIQKEKHFVFLNLGMIMPGVVETV